jgi:S-adenosylmethionine synthetase
VTSKAKVDYVKIARAVYKKIGYKDELEISANIVTQSPDIAMGVDTGGAGDQGLMYGFATDETPEFMPKGVVLAHKLARRLEEVRKSGKIKWLRPDGKTQVTYLNGKLQTVLVSAQHSPEVKLEKIKKEITEKIIRPLLSKEEKRTVKILVNPTGKFIQGGFGADTGLTGRKIMVDTYGGIIPHGGGCFSGKDSTKVDRSGAYMARFVAKNLVANGYGKEVLVSVAYAIGLAEPLMIEAFNEKGENLAEIVRKNFDFRPLSIIKTLNLRAPIFEQSATYGHFGQKNLPWEKVKKNLIK